MRSKMLRLLLVFLVLFPVARSQALILVVSDIDDTIKMTNVNNPLNMLYNTFVGTESFPHLIDIYKDIKTASLKNGDDVEFVYLSASPKMLSAQSWLEENGAPRGKVVQRGLCNLITKGPEAFKFCKLKEIIKSHQGMEGLQIFMFGDNGQMDAQVYQNILNDKDLGLNDREGLNGRAHAYIRKVIPQEKDLPSILYFSNENDLLAQGPLMALVNKNTRKAISSAFKKDGLVPGYVKSAMNPPTERDELPCKDEESWPF